MDRAVSPVVGKALEAGLVVLFIGLVTATLFGSVVPGYRTTAGAEVGERTLATAAQRVQQAVPPNATAASATLAVDLPDTIRGTAYRVRVENRSLVLDHPHPAVGGRSRPALPPSVVSVSGEWASGERTVVRVETADGGLAVTLGEA